MSSFRAIRSPGPMPSVLSRLNSMAKVTNSILLQGTTVGAGAVLDHVILDKNVVIRPGRSLIGYENFPIVLKKNQTV